MGPRIVMALVALACTAIAAPVRINGTNAAVFDDIYQKHKWGGDGVTGSLSGGGSSIGWTKVQCELLTQLVHKAGQDAKVVTFLDAPIGDWFWMSKCLLLMAKSLQPGGQLVYQGVDVSVTALQHAERRRSGVVAEVEALQGNRTIVVPPFVVIDLARPGVFLPTARAAKLSHDSYDIVMCMDALMHLPIPMVAAALWNLNTVGKPGGIFNTNRDVRHHHPNFNGPIRPGEFRPVDVTMPPFNLPKRLHTVKSSTPLEYDDTFRFPLDVSGLPLDNEARRVAEAHNHK